METGDWATRKDSAFLRKSSPWRCIKESDVGCAVGADSGAQGAPYITFLDLTVSESAEYRCGLEKRGEQ